MPKILMKEKKNMNIKRAKQEIKDSIEAYLTKDNYGEYKIPSIRQRPILLMGPPGIGKTQIMEQIARECEIGLVAYTITHHTRQSAIGLPFIREKEYSGQTYSVTEYTMSEIIASVYEKIEQTGNKEGILFIDEICNIYKTNRLHLTFSEKPYENRKFSVNSNPHYLNVSVTLHWTEKSRKLSLYIM